MRTAAVAAALRAAHASHSDGATKYVLCFFFLVWPTVAVAAGDRHVVIVVWDGMRPDFVSQQNTPALWKLPQSGVTFRNHHSVYPSATIVNGTAINTGVYPNRSGILVNHDYRSEIDARKSIDVENVAVVRKGDELSGGKYLAVP